MISRAILLLSLVAVPATADVKCTPECTALNTQNDINHDLRVIYDDTCANGGFGCNVQGQKMCRFCAYRNFGSHKSAPCPPCAMPRPDPPSPVPVPANPPSSSTPAGWVHIGPGQPLPSKGSGDCTGCKLPVQTREDDSITLQDCVNWVNNGCRNDVWPGDSHQPKGCFAGTNAVSFQVGWEGKPAEGMCRAWVCPGTPGVNKWAEWDCYYKDSVTGNNTVVV